ncbi:MAG: energy-coupled thiamine transporter ThiT [Coriobacteriales bacterium]|nr:energy-coupled thiamine transporter ThiT [Coriobacteriales bacterium]
MRTLIITEVALAIALATVLNFVQIRLPINIAGGSINLSMLPIALVALRRGMISGAVAGTAFGFLDLLLEPFILVPVQVLLDYPLPYLLFGLGVGLFSGLYNRYALQADRRVTGRFLAGGSLIIVVALVVGGVLRLVPHVLSGVFFFAEYAADFFASAPSLLGAGPVDSGLNVWVYSVGYNATYVVPSLVCVGICLLVIAPILAKAVPVRKRNAQSVQEPE